MKFLSNKIITLLLVCFAGRGLGQHITKCSEDGSGWILKNMEIRWQKDKEWTSYKNIRTFLFGKNYKSEKTDIREELFSDFWMDSLKRFEGQPQKDTIPDLYVANSEDVGNDLQIRYIFKSGKFKEAYNHAVLHIEELDPLAKIYLNDQLIYTNKNYFIPVDVPLPDQINKKDSLFILIQFPPLPQEAIKNHQNNGLNFPTDNDPSGAASLFRKPGNQFGWDVCPRFLAGNVLTQIKINSWSNYTLCNAYTQQNRITKDSAFYTLYLEINSDQEVVTTLKAELGDNILFSKKVQLKKGKQVLKETFFIPKPKLWWPNRIFQQRGEQTASLYKLNVELNNTGLSSPSACYSYSSNIGIRTVELKRDKDVFGEKFYFLVNGTPVFAKGSNYVAEIFPETYLPEEANKCSSLLSNAQAAGYNMIRVWGGGKYPAEEFLNECDKKGILLWEDFMFAGTLYPGDSAFLNNVKAEAEYQVKRIAQHPCLALWCGNNEIDVANKNWGWQETYKYTQSETELFNKYYDTLFKSILPEAIKKYDPATSYVHTTPLSNWGKKEEFYSGDNHYWGVWHGELSFESYLDHIPRFMSEYGFPSFPSMTQIKKYFGLKSDSLNDAAFKFRMRSYKGNRLIEKYLQDNYGIAKDLPCFVLLTQLQQADAYKLAIEAQRRAKPFCMGTLYWQLNDAWPSISWSTLDYDSHKKAAWFTVSDAYKNIILSASTRREFTEVSVVSDLIKDSTLKFRIRLLDFYGKTIFDSTFSKMIKANSSEILFSKNTAKLLRGKNMNSVVLAMYIISEDHPYRNLFYYVRTKDLNLPQATIKKKLKRPEVSLKDIRQELYLQSDVLVKDVYLDQSELKEKDSDIQFFDLLPGEKKMLYWHEKDLTNLKLYSYKDLVKQTP